MYITVEDELLIESTFEVIKLAPRFIDFVNNLKNCNHMKRIEKLYSNKLNKCNCKTLVETKQSSFKVTLTFPLHRQPCKHIDFGKEFISALKDSLKNLKQSAIELLAGFFNADTSSFKQLNPIHKDYTYFEFKSIIDGTLFNFTTTAMIDEEFEASNKSFFYQFKIQLDFYS